jgi:molybdate transport system substrate-binding protein
VRQVLAKVQLGEADAGWVYRSDAQAAPELRLIEIPASANVRARYPITVLLNAPHPEAGEEFLELVRSAEGRRLIEAGGFLAVTP